MRVRVAGLLIEEDKLLTLLYHYEGGDVYAIPGGGVDGDELVVEALRREYEEELMLQVEVGRLLYTGDMPAGKHLKRTLHMVFEVRRISGEPQLNAAETSAADWTWLSLDRLDEVALYPEISEALEQDRGKEDVVARYLGNCMLRTIR